MAEEIEEIFQIIERGENFLLSGGAGSGKTYTLVQVLNKIYNDNPLAKVACITYTNVAVNEIKERAPFNNLTVSTIHDFLWSIISEYQENLKTALVELIAEGEISYSGDIQITQKYYEHKNIEYREWKKLSQGIVSHDEVITISEYMFEKHKLLSDIVKDSFDFIFIDEYQDTFEEVIRIFFEHIEKSDKSNIVGLFGDEMQSIYGTGVGDVGRYIDEGIVKQVVKEDNRRNPTNIVELINTLRSDELSQKVVDDDNAQNYAVEGNAIFLYSNNEDYDIGEIRDTRFFEDFNFDNPNETKELYLVQKLIADKAGFSKLMDIYRNDGIIYFKNRIRNHLKEEEIIIGDDKSFGDVIEEKYIGTTPKIDRFIENYPDLYEDAKRYPYKSFKDIYLDADKLIGKKRNSVEEDRKGDKVDALISHLLEICECVHLYREKMYSSFIEKTHFNISSFEDKKALKGAIEKLIQMKDKSIENVINFADKTGIWQKDDKLLNFIESNEYIYNRVKKVQFKEIVSLYNYVENYTPYSTQHNIKGAEFDNVFVLLDNGQWNKFNFKYLFERDGTESVLKRTEKIFYVCCSRAKKNLIVYFHQPSQAVLETAKEWFKEENIYELNFV